VRRYPLLKLPLIAYNLMAADPTVQSSVAAEYSEHVSREVARGEWSYHDGVPIYVSAINMPEHRVTWRDARPHTLKHVPTENIAQSEIDATWLTPNMTLRGQRLKQLEEAHRSATLGMAALVEEAAKYGVTKPLTNQIGTMPGDEKQADTVKAVSPQNPFGDGYIKHHGAEAALQAQLGVLKRLGTAGATRLAAAAGKTVMGHPPTK
jgi:hypothetical protein